MAPWHFKLHAEVERTDMDAILTNQINILLHEEPAIRHTVGTANELKLYIKTKRKKQDSMAKEAVRSPFWKWHNQVPHI